MGWEHTHTGSHFLLGTLFQRGRQLQVQKPPLAGLSPKKDPRKCQEKQKRGEDAQLTTFSSPSVLGC